MGPVDVVVGSKVLGHDFGFQQRMECLDGEESVAECAVEGLPEHVLPGRSWSNNTTNGSPPTAATSRGDTWP